MSGLVEEFKRFANLFPEPIALVPTTGHVCTVNARAHSELFQDTALAPEHELFPFLADESDKIVQYLRSCARSAQPLQGLFRFRRISSWRFSPTSFATHWHHSATDCRLPA